MPLNMGHPAWLAQQHPDMAQAIHAARSHFPEFARQAELERWRALPAFDDVLVKAYFPNPEAPGQGEFHFVTDIIIGPDTLTGTLASAPAGITTLSIGDEVTVPLENIADWFLPFSDQGVGGFTVDILKRSIPPEKRKQYESAPPVSWYKHRTGDFDAQAQLQSVPVCTTCAKRDLIAQSYKNGQCGSCSNHLARCECPTCGVPLFRPPGAPPKCYACMNAAS